MRIVVEEDEIQVRCVAQLLAAELPIRDDREARRLAMPLRKLPPDSLHGHVEHGVGELREPVAHVLDAQAPREIDQQNAEDFGLMRVAQQIHLMFGVLGSLQARGQRALELGPVERARDGFVVEQFIEQLRMADQIARRPVGARQHG